MSSQYKTTHLRARRIARGPRIALRVLIASTAISALGVLPAFAASTYTVTKVLVNQQEYQGEAGMIPAPIYKPHDTAGGPGFWVTSNEQTGCAGITVLQTGTDKVLATVNIDEPAVEFHGGGVDEDVAPAIPCVGTAQTVEEDVNFAPSVRMNPRVCLPVVLPPGAPIPVWQGVSAKKGPYPNTICAPLGAESHPRHPHGIVYDPLHKMVYQVIEHSGLRWNADRTAFQVANTTDEESGLILAWNLTNPAKPVMGKAYLEGHGAHELTVDPRNGLVFGGNHESSPGVYLTPAAAAQNNEANWVDVINPAAANPYGFIDVGYYDAIEGIQYVPGATAADDVVLGVTHVGEKMFAFDAACVSQADGASAVPPPAPPGNALPSGDIGMKMGWNCIKYWVDLRPAFLSQVPNAQQDLAYGSTAAQPNVLHFHNLAADPNTHTAYMSLHTIHHSEHTGLDHSTLSSEQEEEIEHAGHIMGRWIEAVSPATAVDPTTKQATANVRVIDLSHGYDALKYPNGDDIQVKLGVTALEKSFVHGHFLAVDPARSMLLVSGEHTGNLAVIDEKTNTLTQVIPISKVIPACSGIPNAPYDQEEPHVHGVMIDQQTGMVYVSDEGEHCWFQSVTILKPSP